MTARALPESPAGPWRIRLEVDEAESKVAAALDDQGTIIGLATAGATRDDDTSVAWELYSIQVTAAAQGSGLADELIGVTAGNLDTSVWVLTGNLRAQRFYLRHGFRIDGATRSDDLTGAAQEVRMVRRSAGR